MHFFFEDLRVSTLDEKVEVEAICVSVGDEDTDTLSLVQVQRWVVPIV